MTASKQIELAECLENLKESSSTVISLLLCEHLGSISVCINMKHSSSLLNTGNAFMLAKTLQKLPSRNLICRINVSSDLIFEVCIATNSPSNHIAGEKHHITLISSRIPTKFFVRFPHLDHLSLNGFWFFSDGIYIYILKATW